MKYRQGVKKNSYQIGRGPEIPWWERKGRRKQYVRFACRVRNTQKKYSREVEFKRLLQFSFNSCQQAPRKREGWYISWVYKISKNPESFWERKCPREEKKKRRKRTLGKDLKDLCLWRGVWYISSVTDWFEYHHKTRKQSYNIIYIFFYSK